MADDEHDQIEHVDVEVHQKEDEDTTSTTTKEPEDVRPRGRKLTAKALEYVLKNKRTRLEQLSRALEKNSSHLLDIIAEDADSDSDIQKGYKTWIALYDEFLSTDNDYRPLLSEQELEDYEQDWFTVRNEGFIEFKNSAQNWFKRKAKIRLETADTENSYRSAGSVISRMSRASKGATVISTDAQQKRAELEVKKASLKKRKQIEEAKLLLKMQEEELKLEEELAISEAQCKILEDTERKSRSSRSSPSIGGDQDINNNNNNSSSLMAIARHLNKPASAIDKFGGNPLEYPRFLRQFKTRVLANCDDFDEKLNYLEQYTVGEANKIVVGYSYLDAKAGYEAALKELETRYGDSDRIVDAFVKKALSWPQIRQDNPKGLDDFAIFLSECEHAVQSLDSLKVLEYTENFKKIVSKLPYNLHDRWRGIVHDKKEHGKKLLFTHLVQFVRKEAKKWNDPTFGREALTSDVKGQKKPEERSRASFGAKVTELKEEGTATITKSENAEAKQSAFSMPCIYCKGTSHSLESCRGISAIPFHDRLEFLKSKGFCFGCLRFGHQKKLCKNKATCKQCQGRHPSLLHVKHANLPDRVDKNLVASACTERPVTTQEEDETKEMDCTMAIIPVKVKVTGSNHSVSTYAFIDPGSNVSFCSEKLMNKLGKQGKCMRLRMDTMGVPYTMKTYELTGVEVLDLEEKNSIVLPTIYSKNTLPASRGHIPTTEDLKKWPHLKDITLPQLENADVGLLIGNNIPDACTPLETRVGPRGSPHASRSVLGWIPWSVFRTEGERLKSVNRADVVILEELQLQDLQDLYVKSINMDFPEKIIEDKKEQSVQDKSFLKKVSESQRIVDGHHELRLPFRKDSPELPDNHYMAMQRLASLRKKFLLKPQFHKDYKAFMETLLEKGYAERVPDSQLERNDGKKWYLPHHGIYHPHKPQKIRVVFDCSAKYQGVALNDVLLQGPDLTNCLIGVLLRFRQEPIAFLGDIEKMFYQVMVAQDDRDCLRYYWWPDGDLHAEPVVYRMKVHLFGAVSSPSCSSYALRQTVLENKHQFHHQVAEVALNNFYVDDLLCSVRTDSEAINLIRDLSAICKLGGFRLTKWITNSRHVLETVPQEERAADVANLDFEEFPVERALGISWEVETDTLVFDIKPKFCEVTRRQILSIIGSIYDPLGLLCPYILPGRIILQDLCRKGIGWDEKLSDSDVAKWTSWAETLPKLGQLKIPRCLKPVKSVDITTCQLHHFADASELGYGMVTYVRFSSSNGQVHHCSLLFAKSRVTPMKKVTIPRLELTAATLAVKMNRLITSELQYKIDETYFWTDSMAVLRYIANESARFHTFVANRLEIIREGSKLEQWRYIDSGTNPADYASRGMKIDDAKKTMNWMAGPAFLKMTQADWPKDPLNRKELSDNDPEIKRLANAVVAKEPHVLQEVLHRFSEWIKVKRTVGWILLFVKNLRARVCKTTKEPRENLVPATKRKKPMKSKKGPEHVPQDQKLKHLFLSQELLQAAEMKLIRYEQQEVYAQELEDLSSDTPRVKNSSSVKRLDPFLEDGIIRVGGRLSKSSLPYAAKHPILIPRESHLSTLIIHDVHRKTGHQGKNAIVAELRQKYWIPHAGQIAKSIVSRCVDCRKYSAPLQGQKMADLPADRVTANAPAFTNTGMDYFGPLEIKRGRTVHKRYGVLFTCAASRAVHIEVAYSLTTDSCVNAIRRFLARRGQVASIRSDNGTNMVGAEAEMRKEIDKWNHSQIGRDLQKRNIDWLFNPPSASHFGGFWERLIRSVRKIMSSLLKEMQTSLDDEALQTVMCEVEQILNNRPLTASSTDPNDLETLTPNHLLLAGCSSYSGCPPGEFSPTDKYVKRQWRRVQYIANVFWSRWSQEYAPLLQRRQKWLQPQRNVKVGDLVLIAGNTPRNVWSMGRVLQVHSDSKGLVRVVTLKTQNGELKRPVHKLCLLLEADD